MPDVYGARVQDSLEHETAISVFFLLFSPWRSARSLIVSYLESVKQRTLGLVKIGFTDNMNTVPSQGGWGTSKPQCWMLRH